MYADLYKHSERDPFAIKQDGANESRQAHYINPAGLTPENWKSSDGMYPDNRGGFSKEDRALWRKDRYNAVYGRYRDKNGEYRNKNGHMIGVDNIPLLTFNDDKPFPGWANGPGSQFHPDDHPKVDQNFYHDKENWPSKGLRALTMMPFEDDWDEKGIPVKSEFHDLTDLPAFNGLNQKQLPERVPMNKMFELQQQALNKQMQAAQQPPSQTANTIQQIGSLVQTAAPLVMQGLSALASAASSGGEAAKGAEGVSPGGGAGAAGNFSAAQQPAQSSKPSYQTLEHRPEDNIGSIPMQTLEMEYDPNRPPAHPVPLSAGSDENMLQQNHAGAGMSEQAAPVDKSFGGNQSAHPVDKHGLRQLENYWNDVRTRRNMQPREVHAPVEPKASPDVTVYDLDGIGNKDHRRDERFDPAMRDYVKYRGADHRKHWTASDVVENARRHLGSEAWNKNVDRGVLEDGDYKCNQFVYEMLKDSGADVPLHHGHFKDGEPDQMPSAADWGDPDKPIDGWEVVDTPQPGDVVAWGGHVGIVSGDGTTISASSSPEDRKVVENDFGFRPHQKDAVFRRYSGNSILIQ